MTRGEDAPISTASPVAAAPRRSLQADTLAASVVILLAASVIQRSVGFARGILFCRWLTPETLGAWELAQSFLLLAAPLAVLGVPGSFGRYAEHYRAQGNLRSFVTRTAAWTLAWSLVAIGALVALAPQGAEWVFGDAAATDLMLWTALALGGVILHHTMTSLLTAIRLYRVVSVMNFAHSLLFAVIALGLALWSPTALSVVLGYGVASLLAGLGALAWTAPELCRLPQGDESVPHNAFWPKLLQFAFYVWLTNLLGQLFAIADRYMIMHYSGLPTAEAVRQVGVYHSSRVVPVMLISFADLLGGLVMPHLSRDWENGRRDAVSDQLNFAIKLTSCGMLAFSAAVLWGGPFLFNVVLQGRYAEGLSVMPWTMAGCAWYGIFCVAQNYLWCAERSRLASLPFAIGLAANVALNAWLLPKWGLLGAVVATAVSVALCLGVLLALNRIHGQRIDRGVWIAACAPAALGAGAWGGALAALVLAATCWRSDWVWTAAERQRIADMARNGWEKLAAGVRRPNAAPGV